MIFDINHNRMRMAKKPMIKAASTKTSATFSGKKLIMKIPTTHSAMKIKATRICANNSPKNALKAVDSFFFFIIFPCDFGEVKFSLCESEVLIE